MDLEHTVSTSVTAGNVSVEAARVTVCVVPGAVRVTTDVSIIVVGVPDCVIVWVRLSTSVKVDAGKVWVWVM